MRLINPYFINIQLKYLINILFLVFFIAANSQAKEIVVADSAHMFKSIIHGYWYEVNYIDNLQKTKSPYQSQNSLANLVELYIDTSQMQGDSLEIMTNDIHQGMSFRVYFILGTTSMSFPISINDYESKGNFYELGYRVSDKDTSLFIYHYNKNKKLLSQLKYKRIPAESESAVAYMVNRILFAGKYKAVDSVGQVSIVDFTNEGTVGGLSNFKKYFVSKDFVVRPLNNLDAICFDLYTDNRKCFTFKIKGDALYLYDTIESEDHVTLTRGALKYTLKKLKE